MIDNFRRSVVLSNDSNKKVRPFSERHARALSHIRFVRHVLTTSSSSQRSAEQARVPRVGCAALRYTMASRALRGLLMLAAGGGALTAGVYGAEVVQKEKQHTAAVAAVNAARREGLSLEKEYADAERRLASLRAEREKMIATLGTKEKAVHAAEARLRDAVGDWEKALERVRENEALFDSQQELAAKHMQRIAAHTTRLQRMAADAEAAAQNARAARDAFPLAPRW